VRPSTGNASWGGSASQREDSASSLFLGELKIRANISHMADGAQSTEADKKASKMSTAKM
jgi:hypothetical protein